MSNQDIDGKVPTEAATGSPGTPNGVPETLEQQLEREREARALMRDRLRTTEALAAESHALRARMAQELERVTADRDRLRTEASGAASSPGATPHAGTARAAAHRTAEPPLMPPMGQPRASHAADRPLKPPVAVRSKGPWGALAMLSVLAVAVAAFAWYNGSLPGGKESRLAAALPLTAPAAVPAGNAASPVQPLAAAPSASGPVAVAGATPSTGAVPLPPMSPDAQLAAAPTAAGPLPAAAPPNPAPPEMAGRLRKALDGEGIAAPVDVDAATGRVSVSDPQADAPQRQRTDMLIRAVYAGASLPEPQIEHRWLSPMRGVREAAASAAAPLEAPTILAATASPRVPDVAPRHAALPRTAERRAATEVSVADAEGLAPVLPAGRVTASCLEGLSGRSAARRANMTACMKHSCCSSAANHNSEECRAYDKAYPFTCGAG